MVGNRTGYFPCLKINLMGFEAYIFIQIRNYFMSNYKAPNFPGGFQWKVLHRVSLHQVLLIKGLDSQHLDVVHIQ